MVVARTPIGESAGPLAKEDIPWRKGVYQMVRSHQRVLTTSLQLANLRQAARVIGRSDGIFSKLREMGATLSDHGPMRGSGGTDLGELAWVIAENAQCCAFLAESMQIFAEKLSDVPPTSHELTSKQPFISALQLRALLGIMLREYERASIPDVPTVVPSISTDLAEGIRWQLAHGKAITMEGFTIKEENPGAPTTTGASGTS